MRGKYITCVILTAMILSMTGCSKGTESEENVSETSETEAVYTVAISDDAGESDVYDSDVSTETEFEFDNSVDDIINEDALDSSQSSGQDSLQGDVFFTTPTGPEEIESTDGYPFSIMSDTPKTVVLFRTTSPYLSYDLEANISSKAKSDLTGKFRMFDTEDYAISFLGIHDSDRKDTEDSTYSWKNDAFFYIENKSDKDMTFTAVCDSVNNITAYSDNALQYNNVWSSDTGTITIPAGGSSQYVIPIDLSYNFKVKAVQKDESDIKDVVFICNINNKLNYVRLNATDDKINSVISDNISDVYLPVTYRWRAGGPQLFVLNGNYGYVSHLTYKSDISSDNQILSLGVGLSNNHTDYQSVILKILSVNDVEVTDNESCSVTLAPCSFAYGIAECKFNIDKADITSMKVEVTMNGVPTVYDVDFSHPMPFSKSSRTEESETDDGLGNSVENVEDTAHSIFESNDPGIDINSDLLDQIFR